ncbi:MAG: ribose 5-phosphate isomerase B [Candidatus Brocadiales bacterium]
MKIALASDHRGYELKNKVCQLLSKHEHTIVDCGPSNSSNSVDYPDYALKVAKAVSNKECDRGILVCGTGIGMSLAANKVKGVRAVVAHDLFSAEMSRRHNDSNVLCMGAELIAPGAMAMKIIQVWLDTPFEGERHARRIQKITDLEGS